jgi:hypothetical protein
MFESRFSGKLWPAHLKPQEDELLSSWLLRIAVTHGIRLDLFCSAIWSGNLVRGRDVDRLSDEAVINLLAARTGLTPARVAETTVSAYEGALFEKRNRHGYTPWITSLRIYCLDRKNFGLQFCPRCLAEDREPYFRRRWRLAFVTLCERHHILLSDRCRKCGLAVNPARNELDNNGVNIAQIMTQCHGCGFDLRKARNAREILTQEVVYQRRLLMALQQGWIEIREGEPVYSHLYFRVLLQIVRLLARQQRFRKAASDRCGIKMFTPVFPGNNREIERLSIPHRRRLLGMAQYILDDWPERFIKLCREDGIWSTKFLFRFPDAPYWFWRAIREHLFRPEHSPSEREIHSAINYVIKTGGLPYQKAISELLGVRDAFKVRRSQELLDRVAPSQIGRLKHTKRRPSELYASTQREVCPT